MYTLLQKIAVKIVCGFQPIRPSCVRDTRGFSPSRLNIFISTEWEVIIRLQPVGFVSMNTYDEQNDNDDDNDDDKQIMMIIDDEQIMLMLTAMTMNR